MIRGHPNSPEKEKTPAFVIATARVMEKRKVVEEIFEVRIHVTELY